MAYFVVVDGEILFLLTWNGVNICSMFGKPQGWFISYKPQQTVVYQL